MLKKRVYKIIAFFIVLVTVMNVSVVFENLPNGHFLEFEQEAEAAIENKFNFSCPEERISKYDESGQYDGEMTAKYWGNGNISIVDEKVFGSVTIQYKFTSAMKYNYFSFIDVTIYRGNENIGYYGTDLNFSPIDKTSGTITIPFIGYICESYSTTDILSYSITIGYMGQGTNDLDYVDCYGYAYINSEIVKKKPYSFNFNNTPTITETSPTPNVTLSKANNYFPSMTVSDPDGDTLTCKYYVDSISKGTATTSNTSTPQLVKFNTLDTSTLSDGNHTFKFEVSDGKDAPVSQSVDVTVDNTPPVISSNTSFISDETSITISGSATDSFTDIDSLQYRYTVGNFASNWVSNKSLKIDSLSPNTIYTAKFEARDSVGNVSKTEKQIYTKAQTPQISINKDSIKENSMELLINDSNPATTKYQIMMGSNYVTAAGTLTPSPEWITTTNKKITISGLSQNTQYLFTAKAKNNKVAGSNDPETETKTSEQINGTTLAQPPANIAVKTSINSIEITWNAVSGAIGYDVEADGKVFDVGTALSYTHSGLQAETSHSYRVRVRNAGGTGAWSYPDLSGMTLPNPPETPAITDTSTTQSAITISWDAVAKAAGYEIETDGKIIDTKLNTTYTDEGLEPDSLHKYRVRALNAGGPSEWSVFKEISTLPIPPEVLENLKGIPTMKNITLSWEAADRAEGYELEVDSRICKVETGTSYIHDGLSANSSHTYRIRAWNRGGKSDWSSAQTITTWPEIPATPTNIMATAETDNITVTWYSSPYAESYDLQVDEKETVNSKETSYTNKGLIPGTKHTYKMRAKNISGEGEWGKLVEISTLPMEATTTTGAAILANIAAVVTNKSVTLAWQAVEANAQYEVEVDGVLSDNGKDTVYNHTGLEPVSFHTYRIRTKNANGNGQWCAVLALSTLPNLPGAPSNVKAIAANTQIELSWTKEESIAYEVEVDGNAVAAGEVASYLDDKLKPGTAHTYRVRGKNITGVTAWSDSITKSTTSPTYEVECKNDVEFNFSLLASKVQDFGELTFVVTYNPEELEVDDMCEFTAGKDTTTGKIPGTNITVKYTEGRIEFTVNESITAGTTWSGEISTIVFKPKIDGKANINFSIE